MSSDGMQKLMAFHARQKDEYESQLEALKQINLALNNENMCLREQLSDYEREIMAMREQKDGIAKVRNYAAKVKRESEDQMKELKNMAIAFEGENRCLKEQIENYENEVETLRSMVEQLKIENARKWRVEERNDWKALVKSIQEDRAVLQAENERLKQEIEEGTRESLGTLKNVGAENNTQMEVEQDEKSDQKNNIPETGETEVYPSVVEQCNTLQNGSGQLMNGTKESTAKKELQQLKVDFEIYRTSMEAHCADLEADIERLQAEIANYMYESVRQGGNGFFSILAMPFQSIFRRENIPVIQV
uniref:Uncharacterized protein n=1 Tax=Fibrocapsa japonica TaxID=94617 RepID=A0A7S2V322_9STRA|mmetsp:Transcript_5051/g.7680  ORF Transcript_5051/g.7680 Transcript_5051/m.7680 type:complete len:304 (+) Transcript_5051:38-949(+)|eukprot:CAMPEP_0113936354 /NCGR_PEP_ID=MMETSP1339-20121228/3291_1 /TAXON_ID=94617 /ORGANISM="Fibrocapsa japonica" /LENGTH=303 /DNA_ID=CAMNT_0000938809 /DNA_START=26 /DNA_END=937 /DNA_ORIENTATION=- /assembly_acc=CAM_ASM_000762